MRRSGGEGEVLEVKGGGGQDWAGKGCGGRDSMCKCVLMDRTRGVCVCPWCESVCMCV